jgi:hypothetical protein
MAAGAVFIAACIWTSPVGLGYKVLTIPLAFIFIKASIPSRDVLRVCQFGVRQKRGRKEHAIRFDQLAGFSWKASRVFSDMGYMGTQFVIGLKPRPDSLAEDLDLDLTYPHPIPLVTHILDRSTETVKTRLRGELEAAGHSPWTDHLRLVRDRIEYQAAGLLGRREAVTIPLDSVERWEIDAGRFRLGLHGQKRPSIDEPAEAPNLVPGLALFEELLVEAQAPVDALTG